MKGLNKMRKAFEDILENSQIIKVNNHNYVCICHDWVLKIHSQLENTEYQLYFNGTLIAIETTIHEKFNYESISLDQYVHDYF